MIMYINRVFHKYTFFGIWYCAMLIFSLGQYKMMLEKAFFAKMTPYLWTGATHVKCCIWLNWPYFCECLSAPNMVKWGMAVSSTFVNLLNSMINWSFDIYDLLIDDECLNNRVLHLIIMIFFIDISRIYFILSCDITCISWSSLCKVPPTESVPPEKFPPLKYLNMKKKRINFDINHHDHHLYKSEKAIWMCFYIEIRGKFEKV